MDIVYIHPKIARFFDSLDGSVRVEADRMIHLLAEKGNGLRPPDSKSLGKGLFELRVIDQIHVRILFMFHQGRVVLLHAFIKKTGAIPKRDIEYARRMQRLCTTLA